LVDGFRLEIAMEAVWTMSQSKLFPPPGEIRKERLPAIVEGGSDKTQLPAGFTLRVKPDRRRVQLPIPPGLDRRRPR
jgi:hypothetical protein